MNDKPNADQVEAFRLDVRGLDDLEDFVASDLSGSDGPRQLALDVIDEDPNQPRTIGNPGFTESSIAEIGETIRLRGVKSPISVRENTAVPGRYLINHGARRYRGSKWAGKSTIPAFVDNDYNEVDQVVENLQRNELTAREIADFIGRELAKGTKRGEIAKGIGKSPAFVTQHATLLDVPEPIAEAFASGRAKDVTVVNELVTAHKKSPGEVSAWLAEEGQELTRGSVKLLRQFLTEKRRQADDGTEPDGDAGSSERRSVGEPAGAVRRPRGAWPGTLSKAIVQVRHEHRPARLILNRRPAAQGRAWLKYEDDGREFEAELGAVQLVALLEG